MQERIEPHFLKKLHHAGAKPDTVQGSIGVHWRRKAGPIRLNVQISFGITADICPGRKTAAPGSGFRRFEAADDSISCAD